jgi:uncharacterized protein (DUF2336 family)
MFSELLTLLGLASTGVPSEGKSARRGVNEQGMASFDVNRLLQLAADRNRASRAELANAVLDLALPDDQRLTEQQRALIGDVLGKLISSLEIDVRRNLADALLRSKVDLPELERMLSNDDIEVARPVLEKSKVLRDLDLIDVVKQRSDEHRMAVALRANLSADVTDAIVDSTGNVDVLEALLRNDDAVISRRAMEYLVSESKRIDRFQEPLLSRNDLPAELAHRMYWWVSAALRRRILRDFTIDEATLDQALQDATRRAMAEVEDGQSAQARAVRLARRLLETGELTDVFLLRTLRQQRLNLFIAGLAERGGVSFRTAWKAVTDRGFESFLVLARAIDLGRDTMVSIVLLLADLQNPEASRRPDVLTTILKLYQEIEPAQAVRVLKLWQRDVGYQRAIEDLEDVAAA